MSLSRFGVHLFLFALLFVLTFGLPVSSAVAETVAFEAAEENGYGRLVFGWPDTGVPADPNVADERVPPHEALVSAGVLVIKFERAFDIDTDELLRRMPNYLALVRVDPDAKAVRMAMKLDFKIHTRKAGNELYVDLLPPGWSGAPPPLPAAAVARLKAEEEERQARLAAFDEKGPKALEIEDNPPSVELRVGERPGFTRLSFAWDRPVLYSTDFRDNRITVTFDQIAELALSSLRVDPPALIKDARLEKSGGRLTIFIETEPGVKVRDFREDLSVVLDVSPSDPAAAAAAVARAEPTLILPVPESPLTDPVKAAEVKAAAAAEADGLEAPAYADRAGEDDAVPSVDEGSEQARSEDADAAVVEATDALSDAEPPVQSGEGEPGDDKALTVLSEVVGRSVRLTFPWSSPVDAAVFQREGRVWMVFDRATALDLSRLGAIVLERLGEPQIVTLERATVLQFVPNERVLLAASEKDTHWIVTLGDVIVEPTRPVSLTRAWSAGGEPKVLFDLEEAGRIHWVRDPVIQDTLAVVTAEGPPQGVLAPRNFVEFEALATAQGLAFVSRADDLYVAAEAGGIAVSRGSGLTLSAGDGPGYASAAGRSVVGDASAPARMDFERWRFSPGDTFTERKQFHQRAVSSASPEKVVGERIKYAKFLLAYRLGAEAYTMLRAAKVESELIDQDPAYRALMGVANVMMARYDEAVADLSSPKLAEDPHAALWLGVAEAGRNDWAAAGQAFSRAEQAFAFYDTDLQALFRVKAAEAALLTGDIGSVEFNLDRIPEDVSAEKWGAEAALVRGRMFEASGRVDEALEVYDRLVSSEVREVAARARFGHAMLRYQLGGIEEADLVRELQSLRLAWRGDDLELAVLEQLGELLIARGELVDGLNVWRSAVGQFPETERGRKIASRMTDTFADLFLARGADTMDPVEALTVYYNFRELTPIGRRGDALIRDLADRMVEVDLLDKAADLLQHQVDNRLRGAARSQVAAKLALIYLMNHQPAKALQAIRSTKQVRLPDDLTNKRRLLEARALSDLGLYDHALDLLSETDAEGVADLVAEIHWASQQWDVAAVKFEEALGLRWRDPLELTAEERFQVMRAAISYSLADNAAGIERIRSKFGDLMRKSPDASSFAVVTDPIEMQGVAFRDLAKSVAATDTLDSFVASFKGSFSEPLAGDETGPAIN